MTSYKAGGYFVIGEDVYVLAAIGPNKLTLISIRSGKRWCDAFEPENGKNCASLSELEEVASPYGIVPYDEESTKILFSQFDRSKETAISNYSRGIKNVVVAGGGMKRAVMDVNADFDIDSQGSWPGAIKAIEDERG